MPGGEGQAAGRRDDRDRRLSRRQAAADRKLAWTPLLLAAEGVENSAARIAWKTPVDRTDGIGRRFTMTDSGRICLQPRRLEPPLGLVRWDATVARYEQGRCANGTAGTMRELTPRR